MCTMIVCQCTIGAVKTCLFKKLRVKSIKMYYSLINLDFLLHLDGAPPNCSDASQPLCWPVDNKQVGSFTFNIHALLAILYMLHVLVVYCSSSIGLS